MLRTLRELAAYHELLYMIAWREIKIKYKQTILGFLWAIMMPVIIVMAGMLVRYAFSILSGEPLKVTDIASVSIKAVPWAFFVSSIRFGANSLIANTSLVTKIYMPREVFPIASVLSQLFDFVVASVALAILLGALGIGVSHHVLVVPVIVLLLVMLTTGLAIIVSAASLFFRDVKYLVEVIVTFAIFFTPVFYEASLFGEWAQLLMLNPIAPLLEGLNDCLVLHQAPDWGWLTYSAVVSASILARGLILFKKVEPAFAESI